MSVSKPQKTVRPVLGALACVLLGTPGGVALAADASPDPAPAIRSETLSIRSEDWAEPPKPVDEDRFNWNGALVQSSFFLGIQHAYRTTVEADTKRELGGPFIGDYLRSFRGLSGWDDGDEFYVNYLGHPLMGSAAGYIQVHNDPAFRLVEFGEPGYWRSRLRAAGFAALYSTMFEIGPLSEASIGNVGKDPATQGAVDFVTTPVGGFGFMVLEDALDRYVIQKLERRSSNRWASGFYRTFLNPTRTFANLMRLKRPWYRDRGREPVVPRRPILIADDNED